MDSLRVGCELVSRRGFPCQHSKICHHLRVYSWQLLHFEPQSQLLAEQGLCIILTSSSMKTVAFFGQQAVPSFHITDPPPSAHLEAFSLLSHQNTSISSYEKLTLPNPYLAFLRHNHGEVPLSHWRTERRITSCLSLGYYEFKLLICHMAIEPLVEPLAS